MSYTRQMLDTYPRTVTVDATVLAAVSTRSATAPRRASPTPTPT